MGTSQHRIWPTDLYIRNGLGLSGLRLKNLPRLNFKYGYFAVWEGHVPVIFMTLFATLSSLKLLFQGLVTCQNSSTTRPQFWVMIGHQYGISALMFLRCHFATKPVVAQYNIYTGCLTSRREKEGELETVFLEFEYPHRVSAKCWLAEMTLVMIFHVFFTVRIRACFRFELIGRNLTAQPTGSNRGIGGTIHDQTPEM